VRVHEAAEVLLVRAIEESRADALPPEARRAAAHAADALDEERAWLARRARFLLEREGHVYRPLLGLVGALRTRWPWLLLPFALGLGTNYLGPSERIHVLRNPIAVLVVWNFAVYAVVGWRALARRRHAPERPTAPEPARVEPAPPARRRPPAPGPLAHLLLGRALPALWLRAHRVGSEGHRRATDFAGVGRRFWAHWLAAAEPWLWLRARQNLHLAAAALAVGAVLGMFVRGLFFDYAMVWQSTFVRDPEWVTGLLRVVLGPAALLLGRPLPTRADVDPLFTAEGAPAAPWIELWAAAALVYAIGPRVLLAAAAALRLRAAERRIELPLADAYFAALLESARAVQVERISAAIHTDVRIECAKLSEAVAVFVAERLYDGELVPILARFRSEGGRIEALEDDLRGACERFEPELESHLPQLQRDFERALAAAIERTLGSRHDLKDLSSRALGQEIGAVSHGSAARLGGSLGLSLSAAVGTAVSAAVALAAGTVSGGFGKALGAAILVTLLGTSGPVGFAVGALGGLVVAAAGFALGRDSLSSGVRRIALPGALVRLALPSGRFERLVADGRAQCRRSVKELVDDQLTPLVPRIAERIWNDLRPALVR
jgi:hypothetical protein